MSRAVHDFCQVVEGFERSIILLELDREDFSRESNKKMLGFFRSIVKQETALLFRVLFFQVIHLYTLNNECISYVNKKSVSHVQ